MGPRSTTVQESETSHERSETSIPVLSWEKDPPAVLEALLTAQHPKVFVTDLPIAVINDPDLFPTDEETLTEIEDSIIAHFDGEDPSYDGILVGVNIIAVPDPTAPFGYRFEIWDGYHRVAAKAVVFKLHPSQCTRTVPAFIEISDDTTLWRRRVHAQTNKGSVAPARILLYITEAYQQTEFGKAVNIMHSLRRQNIVDAVLRAKRTKDLHSIDEADVFVVAGEALTREAHRLQVSPELLWKALSETRHVLVGFNISAKDALRFIRVGRELCPEIARLIRRPDPHVSRSFEKDTEVPEIPVQRNEIPLTVAETLAQRFPGTPNFHLQRALYPHITRRLSGTSDEESGISVACSFIERVSLSGIPEALHQFDLTVFGTGEGLTREQREAHLLSILVSSSDFEKVTRSLQSTVISRLTVLPHSLDLLEVAEQLLDMLSKSIPAPNPIIKTDQTLEVQDVTSLAPARPHNPSERRPRPRPIPREVRATLRAMTLGYFFRLKEDVRFGQAAVHMCAGLAFHVWTSTSKLDEERREFVAQEFNQIIRAFPAVLSYFHIRPRTDAFLDAYLSGSVPDEIQAVVDMVCNEIARLERNPIQRQDFIDKITHPRIPPVVPSHDGNGHDPDPVVDWATMQDTMARVLENARLTIGVLQTSLMTSRNGHKDKDVAGMVEENDSLLDEIQALSERLFGKQSQAASRIAER